MRCQGIPGPCGDVTTDVRARVIVSVRGSVPLKPTELSAIGSLPGCWRLCAEEKIKELDADRHIETRATSERNYNKNKTEEEKEESAEERTQCAPSVVRPEVRWLFGEDAAETLEGLQAGAALSRLLGNFSADSELQTCGYSSRRI